MTNQLSDLDELLQKVRNRNSKEYLKEAITSYRAGAYRAAVTSTWMDSYLCRLNRESKRTKCQ
ncbi:MAG TPA: hypothetical protein EYP92_02700 [Candidatus Thioglobus sp.]|nr:hypothetical protein [Candidatus Thioglobus sp.]